MTSKTSKTDVLSLSGISYIIYTDGDIQNVRQNQPCYGEMRKYERTHKGECTQPENSKPGDLHSPFPDGTPTGVEVNLSQLVYGSGYNDQTDRLFRAFFSDESPWISGFKDVILLKKNDRFGGIRIPHGEIDTTVLVNALKNFRGIITRAKDFCELVDNGLTNNEAIAALTLNSCSPLTAAQPTGVYSGPRIFQAKRFFQQRPNDLTGGFLKDRIDYNRTLMADPFTAMGDEASTGIAWQTAAIEAGLNKYGTPALDIKKQVNVVKTVFGKALEKAADPVEKPFIWKTTSGKIRGEATIALSVNTKAA